MRVRQSEAWLAKMYPVFGYEYVLWVSIPRGWRGRVGWSHFLLRSPPHFTRRKSPLYSPIQKLFIISILFFGVIRYIIRHFHDKAIRKYFSKLAHQRPECKHGSFCSILNKLPENYSLRPTSGKGGGQRTILKQITCFYLRSHIHHTILLGSTSATSVNDKRINVLT